MGTGNFWDATGIGNPKHLEKNVYQCHIIRHKSPCRLGWDLTRVSTVRW